MTSSLGGTAIIQTQSYQSDGGGGGTTVWTKAGSANCRITTSMTGDERVQGGRIHTDTEYILTLPAETSVTDDSQILYGSQTFALTAIHAPRTWEVSRRVELKEVS